MKLVGTMEWGGVGAEMELSWYCVCLGHTGLVFDSQHCKKQVWWHFNLSTQEGRQRQQEHKFKVTLC